MKTLLGLIAPITQPVPILRGLIMPDSSLAKCWQDRAISLLAIFVTVCLGVIAGMGAYWQSTIRMEARMSTAERQIQVNSGRLDKLETLNGSIDDKLSLLKAGQSRIEALLEAHMDGANNTSTQFENRGK